MRDIETLIEVSWERRTDLAKAEIDGALKPAIDRVHDARIATFGGRAEDFFVITDERDLPLSEAAQAELRQALEQRFGVGAAQSLSKEAAISIGN